MQPAGLGLVGLLRLGAREEIPEGSMTDDSCSILICHYDRVDVLEDCIRRLQERFGDRYPIVVADDGSPLPVREQIATWPGVRLITGDHVGLGASCNRGLRAIDTTYVLQTQDDFLLQPDASGDMIDLGIRALTEHPELDLIRYNVPSRLRHGEHLEVTGAPDLEVLSRSLWRNPTMAPNLYSDRPHLKRRSFTDRFGWYLEGRPMGVTELEYAYRAYRSGVRVGVFDRFRTIFDHGSDDRSWSRAEPSQSAETSLGRFLPRERMWGWAMEAKVVLGLLLYLPKGHFPFWLWQGVRRPPATPR